MAHDQTGAAVAALSFGLLFVCMLGLLAISDIGDAAIVATVGATNLKFTRYSLALLAPQLIGLRGIEQQVRKVTYPLSVSEQMDSLAILEQRRIPCRTPTLEGAPANR